MQFIVQMDNDEIQVAVVGAAAVAIMIVITLVMDDYNHFEMVIAEKNEIYQYVTVSFSSLVMGHVNAILFDFLFSFSSEGKRFPVLFLSFLAQSEKFLQF